MSLCQPELGHRGRHRPGKPTRIPEPKTRGEGTKNTQNSSFLYKIHKIQTRENYIQKKEDTKRAELSCLHPYRKVSCAGAGAGSRGHRPPWRVPPIPSPVAGHPAPAAFLLRRQRLRLLGTCRGRGFGVIGDPSPQSSLMSARVSWGGVISCATPYPSLSSRAPHPPPHLLPPHQRTPHLPQLQTGDQTSPRGHRETRRVAPCRWELGRGIRG